MEIVQRRRPRFRRSENPPPLGRITERDLAILREVDRNRFLRSTHILALFSSSRSNDKRVLNRLSVLFHNGYLDRPPAQLDQHRQNGGSPRMIYGLARKGAVVLDKMFNPVRGRVDRAERTSSATNLNLRHALAVSDFMVAIELACRAHSDVKVIQYDDILCSSSQPGLRPATAARWPVAVPWRGANRSRWLIPDKVFGLRRLKDGKEEKRYFLLEADRGTMPVIRRNLQQTSHREKMLAYEQLRRAWRQNRARAPLGFSTFQVLTLTTSARRVENLVRANQALFEGRGSTTFLFSDVAAMQYTGILDAAWTTGRGEAVRLFPEARKG